MIHVLILEDSDRDYELISGQLEETGLDLQIVHNTNQAEFEDSLKARHFDIIISDYNLPGFDAFGALEICLQVCPDTPFICVSGSLGEEKAIELLKKGAVDYVLKDRPDRLPFAFTRALEEATEKAKNKRAEEKIRQLSQAIVQSPVSVLITNLKGEIEYANPKFLSVTGYDYQEVWRKNPRLLKSGHQEKEFYKILWKTIKSGKTWKGEILNKKKNEELYWESATISPVKNDHGKITHFLAVKEDITEQKIARQQLAEREEYYRSILKTIPDPLFIMDRNGIIIDLIAETQDLPALPDALLGKKLNDILTDIEAQKLDEVIQKAFVSRELIEFPYSIDIKGEKFHYLARIFAFGEDKLIALSTDITERVNNQFQIEALLVETKEQNTRLKNFTQIVSHNLRSHVSNMLGLLKILQIKKPEYFDNDIIKMFDAAAQNLNQTIGNLNKVLEVSLTNRDAWSVVRLKKAVNDAIDSVMRHAAKEDVAIINEVDEHISIKTVPAYLESIVLNLVSNGIKYKSQSQYSYVKISTEIIDEILLLKIQDNGLGIDLVRHGDELFGMYKTFHKHKDAKGLGLFITKAQVEAMNGKIEVESAVDEGTFFKIYLPNYETNQQSLPD
jgi:PAS domain S-box-containing protein